MERRNRKKVIMNKFNLKWVGLYLLILVGFITLSSLTVQEPNSWEQKYYELKKERDYYKKTSEKLLSNWKQCESKVNQVIAVRYGK